MIKSEKSFFCTFEGLDGSGTTTHSKLLTGFLLSLGLKVYLTQEPTNNDIGLLIRNYLKDKEVSASLDALLFAADRVNHYHNDIKKKLEKGFIVISDRYKESSVVYQSLSSEEISIEWIETINKFAGLSDLVILLDVDPHISMVRKAGMDLEKFENISFLDRVRKLYLSRAIKEGYYVINTDDVIEVVQEKIQQLILTKLKDKGF